MDYSYPSDTIKYISDLLFCESDKLNPCDLAIVLGNDYLGTMDDVFRLYQNGFIRGKIILTGHSAQGDKVPEAERFYKRGLALGLPDNMMIMEPCATNSHENLLFSKRIIEDELGGFDRWEGVLFVAKAFVLRRIRMTARALDYPSDDSLFYYGTVDKENRNIARDNWFERDISTKRVLEELVRIGQYTLKGDLSLN